MIKLESGMRYMYMYIHVYMYMYIHINTQLLRKREPEKERQNNTIQHNTRPDTAFFKENAQLGLKPTLHAF